MKINKHDGSINFSGKLNSLLNNRNLKQADICRMTGIQTSLMSDYISGKKTPTIGNAVIIADALNISLDELVRKASGEKKMKKISNLKYSKTIKINDDIEFEIKTERPFDSYTKDEQDLIIMKIIKTYSNENNFKQN